MHDHVYMELWTPVWDEMLILKCEPTNVVDRNACSCIQKSSVWYVPFNLSPSISLFLKRDINKAFAKLKVVGEKVNREAGYGLEIACMELVESFWPYTSRLNLKTTSWQQLFTVCESLIRKFTCLHTFMYMCVFIYNCNSWLSSKCVGV